MENNIKKNVLLIITVLLVGLGLAGGTYAWFSSAATITNGNYATDTHCFDVTYTDNTDQITGTMFPSGVASSGLSGRVGLKANTNCNLAGIGTLKLHINSETSSTLTTSTSSYCENRSTLEPISGVSTEAACKTAGGRWRGYGDSYCESNTTLERLTTPTDSASCTSAGGTWKSGGSPLKYAVYNNANGTGYPLSKGYITSSDIGNDITIYDEFIIDTTQHYYYIFIWLDGYLVDNTVNNLPFSGYISASAIQTNIVYTVNTNADVIPGQPIPSAVARYTTPSAAMAAFDNKPFFLMHRIQGGVVAESYVGFVVTSEIYYLKAFVDESSLSAKPVYEANREMLKTVFSSGHCEDGISILSCSYDGLTVVTYDSGDQAAYIGLGQSNYSTCSAAYNVSGGGYVAYCY